MTISKTELVLEKLHGLRTELVELAFALERKGRLDAADIALSTSTRLADLHDELRDADVYPCSETVGKP